ncbi:XAC0095 family protein [Dyella sp.]|uniref:XAC0095 family protein n=1 Tax=Dyella sp. TaxID=1869338 RepID=UPI002ED469D2
MAATAQPRALLGQSQPRYQLSEIEHALLRQTCDELQLLADLCSPLTQGARLIVPASALSYQYSRLASQLTDVLDSCQPQLE